MWVGLLTDRINNKLEKRNLINEHALNREPVPLTSVKRWKDWSFAKGKPYQFCLVRYSNKNKRLSFLNISYLLNAPAWTPKIKWSIRSFTVFSFYNEVHNYYSRI